MRGVVIAILRTDTAIISNTVMTMAMIATADMIVTQGPRIVTREQQGFHTTIGGSSVTCHVSVDVIGIMIIYLSCKIGPEYIFDISIRWKQHGF